MSSTLNIDQKKGIKAIEDNRLVVVEGGPGTGKSFMIRSLLGRPDFGPTLVVAIANAALAHYPHQYTANLAQVKARLGRKKIGRHRSSWKIFICGIRGPACSSCD